MRDDPANHAPVRRTWRLQDWLRIRPEAKPVAYQNVFCMAEMANLKYWLEIFFSAGIATFGLVENSPAVIIGAMLISPLMGPIMATGLALSVGDLYLGLKAVLNLAASIAVSVAFSSLLVWLLPFHSPTAEILARTNPNLLDLGIALLSGLAGSVVVCRGTSDGATALPGVAIAVALMPPLCTVGFGWGSGRNFDIMNGACLLFLTNLVAIVASAFLVFLLIGMSTPAVQRAMLAAREGEPLGRLLSHARIAWILSTGGRLRWRILMVVVLLGSVAIPLRQALRQVAAETVTRSAVQDELAHLVPPDALVSQQVSIGHSEITIHVISTSRIPDSRVTEARQNLVHRTSHRVQLSVDAVASKVELQDLMTRLTNRASEVPQEKSLPEMEKEFMARLRPAITDIWPSTDAPIRDVSAVLGSSGLTVDVRYQSAADLGDVPVNMVLRALRTKFEMPELQLTIERVPPEIKQETNRDVGKQGTAPNSGGKT